MPNNSSLTKKKRFYPNIDTSSASISSMNSCSFLSFFPDNNLSTIVWKKMDGSFRFSSFETKQTKVGPMSSGSSMCILSGVSKIIEIDVTLFSLKTFCLMEQHDLKKHKQLFECKHLLLLRDIWWSKF